MEFLNQTVSEYRIQEWEVLLDDWIFLAVSALFLFELVRLARQVWSAPGIRAKLGYLSRPPGWAPRKQAA